MLGRDRSSLSARQDHLPMRDSSFLKNRADALKRHSFIKTNYANLGMKVNLLRVLFFRHHDGSLQKLRADAPPAIAFQHRHASYLRAPSMHDHPRRSHGFSRCESEKMKRPLVVAVQLNLFRHTLFSYEYPCANGISFLKLFSGRNSPH